jgi:hypothetical protein
MRTTGGLSLIGTNSYRQAHPTSTIDGAGTVTVGRRCITVDTLYGMVRGLNEVSRPFPHSGGLCNGRISTISGAL